jgi:Tfp pilus assembly protein PilN
MIKINLLAPEMIKKEERNELIILAYAVLAAAVLLGAADYTAKISSYNKLQARVSLSERELVKYESILKQVEALQATTNVLATKKNIINGLMQSRLTYLNFMEDMLEMLPYNLWFKSITTSLAADGKIAANMEAEALDNYAIADFVSSLSANPSFAGVELGALTTTAGAKATTSTFRLKFDYKKKTQ